MNKDKKKAKSHYPIWAYGNHKIKFVYDGYWVFQGEKYFRKLDTLPEAQKWIRNKEGENFGK
jgi:hypothetical protein